MTRPAACVDPAPDDTATARVTAAPAAVCVTRRADDTRRHTAVHRSEECADTRRRGILHADFEPPRRHPPKTN